MKLSHVQRKRFVSCIPDLEKLVTLIGQVVPKTTIGKETEFFQFILDSLKMAPLEKYLSFDLNQVDLALKLKVSKKGEIMGFVELDGMKNINSKTQFALNHFIVGSVLRNPGVEYYLE